MSILRVPPPTDATLALLCAGAAVVAWRAARAAAAGRARNRRVRRGEAGVERRRRGRHRTYLVRERGWTALALATGVLAASHVFGIEWKVVHALRLHASEQGWWLDRRPLQAAALLTAGALALGVLGAGLELTRRASHRTSAAPVLLAALVLAIAGRSVSMHEVDAFLRGRVLGAPAWWLVEAGLLALVVTAGVAATRWRRVGEAAGEITAEASPATDGPSNEAKHAAAETPR